MQNIQFLKVRLMLSRLGEIIMNEDLLYLTKVKAICDYCKKKYKDCYCLNDSN